MNLVLDLVQRLPAMPLLLTAAGGAMASLALAALIGGSEAIVVLLVGVVIVLVSGAALATRVWLDRLPLELSSRGVQLRIDGHRAVGFRVRLGRGRAMDRVTARVRYTDRRGQTVELEPLLPQGGRCVGPFTVVVVDRQDQLGEGGQFQVLVDAVERGRDWTAAATYGPEQVQPGRFRAALVRRGGRLSLDADAWDAVESV